MAILIGLACLIVLVFVLAGGFGRRLWSATAVRAARAGQSAAHRRRSRPAPTTSPPRARPRRFMLVLCVVTLVIWLENPFAAALMRPGAAPAGCGSSRPEHAAARSVVGPPVPGRAGAGRAGRDSTTRPCWALALRPAAWNAVLMLAGGSVSVMSAIEWSVVLGCVVSLAVMIVRIARQPRPIRPSSRSRVRGPITYAGPGSLGGTKSALRR